MQVTEPEHKHKLARLIRTYTKVKQEGTLFPIAFSSLADYLFWSLFFFYYFFFFSYHLSVLMTKDKEFECRSLIFGTKSSLVLRCCCFRLLPSRVGPCQLILIVFTDESGR